MESPDNWSILSTLPIFTKAQIVSVENELISLNVGYSVRDLKSEKKRALCSRLTAGPSFVNIGVPTDVFPSVAPGGNTWITFKQELPTEPAQKKRLFLQTWKDLELVHSLEVTEKHGPVYTDDIFGPEPVWDSQGRYVAYIAESLPVTPKNYIYTQDWGEKFTGKLKPVLVLYDLDNLPDPLKIFDLPQNISPAKPIFLNTPEPVLLFLGYEETVHLHGLIGCTNRPNQIYQIALNGEGLEPLGPINGNKQAITLCPDASSFIYLFKECGGAHDGNPSLRRFDTLTKSDHVIIPHVEDLPSSDLDFHGLYADRIPHHTYNPGSKYVFFNTCRKSQQVIGSVNLESGKVAYHVENGDYSSWVVLAVRNHLLIATKSSPNNINELMMGSITFDLDAVTIQWRSLYSIRNEVKAKLLAKVEWEVIKHPERHHALETILLKPKDEPKPPLIIFPHGGPHVSYDTSFQLIPACLALLGFAVALVNYTGSKGFGKKSVDELIGNIGEMEVMDTQYVAESLKSLNIFDKIGIFGGSHGGFITAHLLGRFPDFYQTGVARNPVINIGSMAILTDIPDWCFAEAGLPYDFTTPTRLSPSLYQDLYEKSPIKYVDQVKAPVLLMLGEKDRRVPMSQGLQWFKLLPLKEHKKCLLYPEDGHSLDTLKTEVHGWNELSSWFLKYLK